MTTLLERVKFLGGNTGGEAGSDDTAILEPLFEGFDRDPQPTAAIRKEAKLAPIKTTGRQPRTGGKFVSNKQLQGQVADEVDMLLKLLAMTWSLSDEECAPVLNECSTAIAADAARLLARSDWLMEHVVTGGLIADSIRFLVTCMPVLRTVWAHHGPGARRARQEQEDYDAVSVDQPAAVHPDRYAPFRPNIATA